MTCVGIVMTMTNSMFCTHTITFLMGFLKLISNGVDLCVVCSISVC